MVTKEAYSVSDLGKDDTGITEIFLRNRDSGKKTIVNVGGSGSSKSFSIAQLLVYKLISEENKRFVIARKTMPACKRSSYDLIIGFLKDFKNVDGVSVYDKGEHNKTDHIFRFKTNEMLFMGLDEPTKIKSVSTGVNYVWMEEANEFTLEDYQMFALQVRKFSAKELNHIYLSLNPIDEGNWIARDLIKQDDVEVVHSTYKNNRFLGADYVKMLEDSIKQSENFYRVYALGEWGKLENLIYRNYKVIPELPDMDGAKWVYGLDFGLVNPSAIIKVYLLNGTFYLEERLYKTDLTNSDIIEFFSHEEKGDIYADPSAKQMIEEIWRAGFGCYEAFKDVKAGLDLCQRQMLRIPESSDNLIKEIRGYHWKKDREGNVLSEPVKLRDHLMDAMRYAIFGITERYGFATLRPSGERPITKKKYRF